MFEIVGWLVLDRIVSALAQRQAERAAERAARLKVPEPIAALGLPWPCSRADVDAAYRRLARLAHPDAGGSNWLFVELQRTRDAALEAVEAAQEAVEAAQETHERRR
jgi:hypothetical protein